ncbi:MAG: AAA family ATPase, partial [Hyphomicrobiales bacterium]|nr:AAA family ATPase [Hyphomicrobiales bacterium]
MNRIDRQPELIWSDPLGLGPSAGMRLHGCEIYNWGTFHGRVWTLTLGGNNALLTGDIGSGKSTLVDAVTTLLVPSQKVSYNKAAGADARERDLRSYVLGHYKSEKGDAGVSSRRIALRSHKDYSVILGRFRNDGFDQDVTLAQVFWHKESHGQPARFYVVADRPMSIAQHFSDFGGEIAALRKRLRATPKVEVYDSFPPYGAAFRRRFGIENEQALDLFHQTVSMKSVGNLTDFVRQHMLEGFPVKERIEALIRHFDDLSRAHEAVLKAKEQIERLAPLVSDCAQHDELARAVELLRDCRNALAGHFAGVKAGLLAERLEKLEEELARLEERIRALDQKRKHEQSQRDGVKRAIADNGGDRIEALKKEVKSKESLKDDRMRRAKQYSELAARAGLPGADTADAFLANARSLSAEIATCHATEADVQNALTDESVSFRKLKDEHADLASEVESLKSRRSNIPARVLAIRERLCTKLGISEDDLPFAGELIEIRESDREWEGAAERVLHNFALSLLVADAHYARVAEWVNHTQLGARLVYYRAREAAATPARASAQSLVRKLKVRPDSLFYAWLEVELTRRFNYACCDTLDEFRRENQALTRAGQIKGRGERHEKDDRHRLDDRTRYVLGWSNEAKIVALQAEMRDLEQRMAAIAGRIGTLQKDRKSIEERRVAIEQIGVIADNYGELDWKPLAVEIEQLREERRRLEEESDVLRTLTARLDGVERALAKVEERLDRAKEDRARTEERRTVAHKQRQDCLETQSKLDEQAKSRLVPQLEEKREALFGEHTLTVENCDARERDMRDSLQKEIDNEDKKITRLRDRIISAMRAYNDTYPLETREVDAAIEAAAEYATMLTELQSDNLPRFEARFKELLNENTIREVA